MSDEEWERWKETFRRAGRGEPPAVVRRAMSDRRRAIFGITVFYLPCAAGLLHGLLQLREVRGVVEVGSLVIEAGILLILGVGAPLATRGTWGGVDSAPVLERIAALERRHAGRRRLMRLVVWAMAFTIVGNLVLFALTAGYGRLAVCAFSVAFAWLVLGRTNRLIERDVREAAEVRELLAEPAEGEESGRHGDGNV